MDPETKGLAIGNCPDLAQAHNSHAVPRARRRQERNAGGQGLLPSLLGSSSGSRHGGSSETFHFVSYVPIRGRLFELDGLKSYPIDHGPILPEGTDWTETFRKVIKERLGMTGAGEPYHDIRFALMAVTPDRRSATLERLRMLRHNREVVIEALKRLVRKAEEEEEEADDNSDQHGNGDLAAVKVKLEQDGEVLEGPEEGRARNAESSPLPKSCCSDPPLPRDHPGEQGTGIDEQKTVKSEPCSSGSEVTAEDRGQEGRRRTPEVVEEKGAETAATEDSLTGIAKDPDEDDKVVQQRMNIDDFDPKVTP